MLRAGQLSERIEIKRLSQTQNSSGTFVWVESDVLNTFAEVKELGASNDMIASQNEIIQTFSFKIRYRQDVHIQIGDKLDWRGRRFEILQFQGGMLNRQYIKMLSRTDNETTSNGEV